MVSQSAAQLWPNLALALWQLYAWRAFVKVLSILLVVSARPDFPLFDKALSKLSLSPCALFLYIFLSLAFLSETISCVFVVYILAPQSGNFNRLPPTFCGCILLLLLLLLMRPLLMRRTKQMKRDPHTHTHRHITYTNTHNHAQAIYISTADIKGKCEEKTENKKENFSASQGVAATTKATIRKFQLLFP